MRHKRWWHEHCVIYWWNLREGAQHCFKMHVCTISNISSGHKGGNGNGAVEVVKKDCHNKPVG